MARARHLSILAHSLLWPTILLALAGWIVSLAGISASQKTCNNTPGILNEVPQFAQTSDLPQIGCKRFLRFPWWIMWGSLVPIVGVAIAAASNRAHPGWVIPFLGLTSIFATLSMIAANYSVNLVDTFWPLEGPLGGSMLKRVQTMFAGYLILAAGLALMLFALGAAMEGKGDDVEDEYAGGKRGYERGGGAGQQRVQQQQQQQPTVTYGAPTGTTAGVPLRTAGAAP